MVCAVPGVGGPAMEGFDAPGIQQRLSEMGLQGDSKMAA